MQARVTQLPELLNTIHPTGPGHLGVDDRGIIALLNPERLRDIKARLSALDGTEALIEGFGAHSGRPARPL